MRQGYQKKFEINLDSSDIDLQNKRNNGNIQDWMEENSDQI